MKCRESNGLLELGQRVQRRAEARQLERERREERGEESLKSHVHLKISQ